MLYYTNIENFDEFLHNHNHHGSNGNHKEGEDWDGVLKEFVHAGIEESYRLISMASCQPFHNFLVNYDGLSVTSSVYALESGYGSSIKLPKIILTLNSKINGFIDTFDVNDKDRVILKKLFKSNSLAADLLNQILEFLPDVDLEQWLFRLEELLIENGKDIGKVIMYIAQNTKVN